MRRWGCWPLRGDPGLGRDAGELATFASRHALLQAARKAMANWGEDELNAALSVHPRIGESRPAAVHAALSRQSSRRWTARMSGSRRPCGRGMPATKPALAGCFNPRQSGAAAMRCCRR